MLCVNDDIDFKEGYIIHFKEILKEHYPENQLLKMRNKRWNTSLKEEFLHDNNAKMRVIRCNDVEEIQNQREGYRSGSFSVDNWYEMVNNLKHNFISRRLLVSFLDSIWNTGYKLPIHFTCFIIAFHNVSRSEKQKRRKVNFIIHD